MTILHLAHRTDWEAALVSGEYRTSTRGTRRSGALRPDWVTDVLPASFDPDGTFRF